MDPLNITLLLCIGFLFFAVIRKITFSAGDVGERAVARKLRWLPKDRYFTINDLMLTRNNGNTTQIDHVVVSPFGIFVIETKNIYGYIHGSDNAKLWRSYWKNRDLAFDNPVLQNQAHIKALKEKLNIDDNNFISIVAFSPNAELQLAVNDTYVVYWTQVKKLILRYKNPVMTLEQAQKIYDYLLGLNIADKEKRKQHATRASINKFNYEVRLQETVENGYCPKCGGRLVLRNGRNGAFYGCSNYPNCRFTHTAYN